MQKSHLFGLVQSCSVEKERKISQENGFSISRANLARTKMQEGKLSENNLVLKSGDYAMNHSVRFTEGAETVLADGILHDNLGFDEFIQDLKQVLVDFYMRHGIFLGNSDGERHNSSGMCFSIDLYDSEPEAVVRKSENSLLDAALFEDELNALLQNFIQTRFIDSCTKPEFLTENKPELNLSFLINFKKFFDEGKPPEPTAPPPGFEEWN